MRTNKKNKLVHCKIKCFDRSMEVKLPAFLGNYDRLNDRRTDSLIGKLHYDFNSIDIENISNQISKSIDFNVKEYAYFIEKK